MSGVAKWMFWLSSPAPNHKRHLLPSAREFAISGPLSPGQCQIRPTCSHPWRKESVANSSLPSSTASRQETSSVPCWPYRAGTEGWGSSTHPSLPPSSRTLCILPSLSCRKSSSKISEQKASQLPPSQRRQRLFPSPGAWRRKLLPRSLPPPPAPQSAP